jgi:hypothetical protein
MLKSEHMQTVGTCGAKERLTHAGTRDIGRGRQCYGQSTVVSDLDVEGFVLNVDGGSRQELDYIEVRTTEQRDKHTRGDDEMTGTLQSMPTSEREVQGLYKVCTGMGV